MKNNKILIITYYWPPAGGPGVQRWLKFSKYLPDFGYEPHVYIPENPNYPLIDKELHKDIHPNVIEVKNKITEPYGFASLLSKKSTKNISTGIIKDDKNQTWIEKCLLFIRGNFFIPDARIGWVNPSVSFLEDYIKKHEIEVVITTGPPHSLHLIGMQLKHKCNIKWIADFRDPWTTIGYHKSLKLTKNSQKKHLALEQSVLQTADHIITTSFSTKEEFSSKTNVPITVITNGYDVEYIEQKPLDKAFSISHIGSLLSERNPVVLWQVLEDLLKENEDFKKDFKLKLIGKVSPSILETLEKFHLSPYVEHFGYVSHKEALIQQKSSQVLLLIEINHPNQKAIIPGKLFEYMAAERPIIAIGPKDADMFRILKETNSGRTFLYDEYDNLKNEILNLYKLYKENKLKSYTIGLQYYSRKKLTEKLVGVILQKKHS